MTVNSTNQLAAGEILYEGGITGSCLFMVLKGKVELRGKGYGIVMGAGSLLGYEALLGQPAFTTATAVENTTVYAISSDSDRFLRALLSANKDYSGLAVYNHALLLYTLQKKEREMSKKADEGFHSIKARYESYVTEAKKQNGRAGYISGIVALNEYAPEDSDFSTVLDEAEQYFEYLKIPVDTLKAFFGNSLLLTMQSLAGMVSIEDSLIKSIEQMAEYMSSIEYMSMELESMVEVTNQPESDTKVITSEIIEAIESLENTYRQLVRFAEYPEDKAEEFGELLERFAKVADRDGSDDEAKRIRKSIAEHYYEFYARVFTRSLQATRKPRPVDLFLDYGFISEKLLTQEQLVELLSLQKSECSEPCVVYTLRQWLTAISKGEKTPSRDDMGYDYTDVLREKRKSGAITEEEEKKLQTDFDAMVEHEIKSVMLHAIRIVNGQLTTFVPILHSGVLIGSVEKSFVSAEKLNAEVQAILNIDFSIFHREALFVDPRAGIEREYEMKRVLPVFIQYPIVGQNIIMWQEITGRKRDTEGRFLIPAFTFNSLNAMLIKSFGQFRWALCKTIQGANWNNIQVKSLTAEYSDYIQFYRKNHDLSDEKKDKIKLQIQRGRNNLREVFTLDYEVWIKSESTGAIKLNKVARDIMALYCPFSAEIRRNVMKQPLFEEGFGRSMRERGKKVHDLELRYRALESKGVVLPEALKETLRFYKEM